MRKRLVATALNSSRIYRGVTKIVRDDQTEQSRIAEYQAAQDCFFHFDSIPWNVGAVIIAGALAFWGFLLNSDELRPMILGVSCFLVNSLVSVWFLYGAHAREIYLLKLERIRELERYLKMEQHLRFVPNKNSKVIYLKTRPGGHVLDYLFYLIISLGSPLLVYFKVGFSLWLVFPVPIWIGICIWVWRRSKNVCREIADRESKIS